MLNSALSQSGLKVHADRGLTDEGDPWFVFCRAEDDEVIVHFARIGRRYVISAPAYGGTAAGADFTALVRSMVMRHPVLQPTPEHGNLLFHPAALLVVLVASALLKAGTAAEAAGAKPGAAPGASDHAEATARLLPAGPRVVTAGTIQHNATDVILKGQQEALILSAIALATATPPAAEIATIVVKATPAAAEPAHHSFASSLQSDAVAHGNPGSGSLTPAAVVPPTHLGAEIPATSAPMASFATQVAALSSGGSGSTAAAFSAITTPLPPPIEPAAALDLAHMHEVPVVAFPAAGFSALGLMLAGGAGGELVLMDTLPAVLAALLPTETHWPMLDDSLTIPHIFGGGQAGDPMHASALATRSVPDAISPAVTPPVSLATTTMAVADAAADGSTAAAWNPGLHEASLTPIVAVSATAAPVISPAVSVAPPAPASHTAALPPAAAPSVVTAPHHTAPLQLPATDLHAVLDIVKEFQAEAAQPVVLVTEHMVVVYDAKAISNDLSAVTSITYDFKDGSSIRLAGLPAELHHAHG